MPEGILSDRLDEYPYPATGALDGRKKSQISDLSLFRAVEEFLGPRLIVNGERRIKCNWLSRELNPGHFSPELTLYPLHCTRAPPYNTIYNLGKAASWTAKMVRKELAVRAHAPV